MFRNYLKIAVRSLGRSKLYTILNVAGLSFGLTCFLLISLYVVDELTFDSQHLQRDRIFRLITNKSTNGDATTVAGGSFKISEMAERNIPGIERVGRMQRQGRANILSTDNPANFFQETVTVADQNFFKIFTFPILHGDYASALSAPNSIVITEDIATKLFNSTDVVGKTIKFNFLDQSLKITGVLKNHPPNSSFNFGSIISDASFQNSDYYKSMANGGWLDDDFSIYTLLKPGANSADVAKKLSAYVSANSTTAVGVKFSFNLQPIKSMHLESENIIDGARNTNVDAMPQGSMLFVKIFSGIALFMLVIAGINYVNLTTARGSRRLKEIGVRKTIGALKANLIKQFLIESLLVTMISFLLAVAAVNLLLPAFNNFSNKHLSLGLNTDYRIWLYAIAFALLTGLLSGSYPAFMLSKFKPVLLLKGFKLQNRSGLSLRKALVVFQFTISIIMIIATMFLILQVRYLNNTNLGFNKELLAVIDVNTLKARSNFEAVKNEMSRIASVKSVSVTSRVPGEWKTFRTLKIRPGGSTNEPAISYMFAADKDFLKTFEVTLLKGRNFESPADSSAILVNETAAALLGIKEPGGQTVDIAGVSRNASNSFNPLDAESPYKPRVVGIVKDFHFQSLRSKIEPLVLSYNNNPIHSIDYYSVRIDAANIQTSLDKLKEVMVNNDKEDPFEYHFLNDQLSLFYVEDARRQTILVWAAIATVFIAGLGLFGLATYSAEQRVKEIGVRKVLGATVLNLTSLLSKDFLKLVLIANGIAFPIAWWAVQKWFQEYAYHVDVHWWVFVLAGVLALLIALFTVSFQSIKAAIANPVKSLKME